MGLGKKKMTGSRFRMRGGDLALSKLPNWSSKRGSGAKVVDMSSLVLIRCHFGPAVDTDVLPLFGPAMFAKVYYG